MQPLGALLIGSKREDGNGMAWHGLVDGLLTGSVFAGQGTLLFVGYRYGYLHVILTCVRSMYRKNRDWIGLD